jgi:hypothetical protein
MNLLLQRYSQAGNSTQSILLAENLTFFSHCIEDDSQGEKGDKRIPAGDYKLTIQRTDTPLTIKHRAAYGEWFRYHIEVSGIVGFSGVYIHAGNDQNDSEGCLLLNDQMGNNSIQSAKEGAFSVQAIKRFYEKYYPLIDKGETIILKIKDEINLSKL